MGEKFALQETNLILVMGFNVQILLWNPLSEHCWHATEILPWQIWSRFKKTWQRHSFWLSSGRLFNSGQRHRATGSCYIIGSRSYSIAELGLLVLRVLTEVSVSNISAKKMILQMKNKIRMWWCEVTGIKRIILYSQICWLREKKNSLSNTFTWHGIDSIEAQHTNVDIGHVII